MSNTASFAETQQYNFTQINKCHKDEQQLINVSKSLHLQTVYSRGKKLEKHQFNPKSSDSQNLNLLEQKTITPNKYSQSKFQILLTNNSNKFTNTKQFQTKYPQKFSNIRIIDQQVTEQTNFTQKSEIGKQLPTQNKKNRFDHSIKYNTEPNKTSQNKINLPFSASPSKRKIINFQQPKFKDDFSEDDNENYYLAKVESHSKKCEFAPKQRSSSPLKNMRKNSDFLKTQKNNQFRINIWINQRYNNNIEQQSIRREEGSSTLCQNPLKFSAVPQIKIRDQQNQKKIQEKQKQHPIFSSEEEEIKIKNDETQFNDGLFKQIKMNEISLQRREGFSQMKDLNIYDEEIKQQQPISSNRLSLNSTDSQEDQSRSISQLFLKQSSWCEEPLNQKFLEEFTQVNKLFLQENLELQVQIDRERVQLFDKKSSSSDVMASINLPEKTESAINRYVNILRQKKVEINTKGQNPQINYKKYSTKDYTWSPYDLVIVVDDNVNPRNVANIKKSINFIVQQSSQFDRVCLVYPNSSEIIKSKLVKCDLSNKQYLNDTLNFLNPQGDIQAVELIEQAVEVLRNRQYKNFISQIYYFTEGSNPKQLNEMINLLQQRNQFTFFVNTFHLKNNNCDPTIQQISYNQQGDYHFIEEASYLPQIAAKSLGQLKSTVGFKSSVMIMPTLDKKFIEKLTIERKYGGDLIWKEDSELEAQSIDLHNLVAGCSKNYSLRYCFPANRHLIGYEQIEKSVFKAACLVFFESQKYQQYIYNEQIKKITFENGDIYQTEQESLIHNPYNPTVLRNSFKYQIIDSFELLLKNLQDNFEREFSLQKFEENLEQILQEYFVEISLYFEEFLEDISQLHEKIQQSNKIDNNLQNKLISFLNAHKYQKSQLTKTEISFNTQISEYYMNYAQFYYQRIYQNQKI